MAGVSAAYITNKLAAEGTTVATVNLILQFLNGATSAAAIAGVEPQEGPVVDDPARGFGDRVRDYDIGLTVAQHTLNKRAAVGTFTSLEQLAGIRGFGADKLHDLLFSFSRTVYEISAIQFNYNTSSFTNDALQLRRNFSTAAPSISWLKGVSTRYEDSPVLYSIKETTGQTLAFRAAFRANGVSGAYVRALGGGRLGTVREQFVSFDSAGYSGYQTFPLDNPTFRSQGVNLYNIAWRWQWRERPTDTWRELVVTKHRAYIVLEAPTLPWVQTPGSTSLPWTDALEIACSWAAFATTRDQAAQRVTERYNACGRVSYDTVSGATMYGSASYNLTEMIERLNGGLGLGEKVKAGTFRCRRPTVQRSGPRRPASSPSAAANADSSAAVTTRDHSSRKQSHSRAAHFPVPAPDRTETRRHPYRSPSKRGSRGRGLSPARSRHSGSAHMPSCLDSARCACLRPGRAGCAACSKTRCRGHGKRELVRGRRAVECHQPANHRLRSCARAGPLPCDCRRHRGTP